MKKIRFIIYALLLIPFITHAQYSKDYIKNEDIVNAINHLGLSIYKYSVSSKDTFNFNLQYQEFVKGKCVDSSYLISEKTLDQIHQILGKSLSIEQDTNFLTIFVEKKHDSIFSFTAGYSFFGMGSILKEISVPFSKFGQHQLHEFASPKIIKEGSYPVLMLAVSWQQKINGQSVQRFCYPDDIQSICMLIPHFYLFNVIADKNSYKP